MKLCYKKFLSDRTTTDIGEFETPEEIIIETHIKPQIK